MPLSEHEQRMLDEMERNLYRHDADFVASVANVKARPSARSIVLGALVTLVGFALVVTALSTHLTLLGVLGFVVVLGGVLLALRTGPATAAAASASSARPSSKPAARSSFMDRMNDRWDRRTS